jgi:hypothetical protein
MPGDSGALIMCSCRTARIPAVERPECVLVLERAGCLMVQRPVVVVERPFRAASRRQIDRALAPAVISSMRKAEARPHPATASSDRCYAHRGIPCTVLSRKDHAGARPRPAHGRQSKSCSSASISSPRSCRLASTSRDTPCRAIASRNAPTSPSSSWRDTTCNPRLCPATPDAQLPRRAAMKTQKRKLLPRPVPLAKS